MSEQSEPTPKRRAELKRMRLYLWLGAISVAIGFACLWGAVKATEAVLPESIALPITLLWCASLLWWLTGYLLLWSRSVLQNHHATEDAWAIAEDARAITEESQAITAHVSENLDKALDLLKQADHEREEVRTILDPIISDLQEQLDQALAQKSGLDQALAQKSGRGRRPLTEDQMRREIERAEQKRAELKAQGHNPTEAEIAKAIGLAPKTLQRYRDRVDNKGQK